MPCRWESTPPSSQESETHEEEEKDTVSDLKQVLPKEIVSRSGLRRRAPDPSLLPKPKRNRPGKHVPPPGLTLTRAEVLRARLEGKERPTAFDTEEDAVKKDCWDQAVEPHRQPLAQTRHIEDLIVRKKIEGMTVHMKCPILFLYCRSNDEYHFFYQVVEYRVKVIKDLMWKMGVRLTPNLNPQPMPYDENGNPYRPGEAPPPIPVIHKIPPEYIPRIHLGFASTRSANTSFGGSREGSPEDSFHNTLKCSKATKDEVAVAKAKCEALLEEPGASEVYSVIFNQIYRLAEIDAVIAEKEGWEPAPVSHHVALMKAGHLQKWRSRLVTGVNPYLIHLEWEWINWFYLISKLGVLHPKKDDCNCREYWEDDT